MRCAACAATIGENAKFCPECGTALSRSCPSCGAPALAVARFCSECGAALSGPEAVPVAPSAPVVSPAVPEERRFITALFVDIVGFTGLTRDRDSEEVRHMLTRYFAEAREIVARFDGVIDKYIGDALMAVWGARHTHEDDAERAVRAGLELVEAVEDLGEELGLPGLRARAGVFSGEAAVGGDGNEATGLIIGDSVNIASRLQGAAAPGAVLVGQSTRDLAYRTVEFEAVGPRELKGRSGPIEVWRAVRAVGRTREERRETGVLLPFVGRADELRLLEDALHAAEREQRIRLVSVVGQAGVGKGRLADELWDYAAGLSQTVYWHQGRSRGYGNGLGFWALAEMVRQRCGIAESDDAPRVRNRLKAMLADYVPDAGDRAWLEPRLACLLGLSETPPGERPDLFAAWRTLFLRIAHRGLTVLVFQNLHWAGDGLLDFIEEMVSTGTEVPILVITLARPELLERRPGWGSCFERCISLHLAALSSTDMEDLVNGVVRDAPPALVDRVVERSGGIPLFAAELLGMLRARGTLLPAGDGRYRMAGGDTELEIPDSLHELVGALLDQLDPQARAVVADAAVLGESFTLDDLLTLQGGTAEDLAEALAPLVRRAILSVERDARSGEHERYRFVRSIVRDVAHQRISRADRLARHLRVAEHLESRSDDELAGPVASHYLEALEAASSAEEQERLRDRVVAALVSAADRIGDGPTRDRLIRLCRRAAALIEDPRERGELLFRAARAATDSDAEELARQALAAFSEAGDGAGRARAAAVLYKTLQDGRRPTRV